MSAQGSSTPYRSRQVYEIVNPHDSYTIEAESFRTAAVACLLLGEGRYGLDGADRMPVFLLGGHEEWLRNNGLENLDAYISYHKAEIAEALASVWIGTEDDRKKRQLCIEQITDPAEQRAALERLHDQKRSSVTDLGRRAWRMAEMLQKQIDAARPTKKTKRDPDTPENRE